MKKILLLSLLFLSQFSYSQNLVPNWSFEDTISCPIGVTQIDRAIGWSSFRQTPDYFNTCNNNQVSVPLNYAGYQDARTGNAYAGFLTFAMFGSNAREIIGVQLIQSLSIGQKYFVSFNVCRAFNPNPGYQINIATNKIGARFSTEGYSYLNPVPIDNISQIYSDSIISDTLNWFKISGAFIADSAYQYLSLGNFFTDSASTHLKLDSMAALAYYYIDDVKVSIDSNFVNGIVINSSSTIVKIFPNPARDWIVVEGKDICRLSLYNVLGELCFSIEVLSSSLVKVNVSEFSTGLYFLNVKTSEESIIQKLIIN